MRLVILLLIVTAGCAGAAPASGDRNSLVCARVDRAPSLDGRADDAAWQGATVVEVPLRKVWPEGAQGATRAWVRAVRTDTHLYILAQWEDASDDSASHKSWVWDAGKNAYVEGPDREDMFAVAFEHTGPFNPDMLAGVESVWDAWQWKASRTNPQGHAMDRSHRYTRQQPQGKSKEYTARDGGKVWIARPEDAGDTVEKKQPAPKEKQGDRVPLYLPGTPTGSAADVRAKGAWSGGRWTVEFERKLDTGHPDDTAFTLTRALSLAISAHDHTGDMDKASGAFALVFK